MIFLRGLLVRLLSFSFGSGSAWVLGGWLVGLAMRY